MTRAIRGKSSVSQTASRLEPLRIPAKALLIIVLSVVAALAAPPPFSDNLTIVKVDGSQIASGFAISVIIDSGVYHMWYRTDIGTIDGIHHATSTDGVNFTTTGALSFSNAPFAGKTAPFLYYENVARLGADYKMFHWTFFGGAGPDFPDYEYNISVSDIGLNPNNLSVFHQGPIGGMGLVGFSAGPFGMVNGRLYCQADDGRKFCQASYVDGNPPNITTPATNTDFNALFVTLGIPAGYINNHSDVIAIGSKLSIFFTVRDDVGNRFNQQVYYSESTDGGTTWSAPVGLFGTPKLNGLPPGGNFAHADVVITPANTARLYLSTVTSGENFVIATTTATLVPPDAYQVAYAANLPFGDSYVNITNAGTRNGADPDGGICANVYVFDPLEELMACCSCYVSPDGLRALSALTDLTVKTLHVGIPNGIVVKLLASTPGTGATCNPVLPSIADLQPGMRAWNTSLHLSPSGFKVTENAFKISALSESEIQKLTTFCGFIKANGSTFGICNVCQTGGLLGGATR